MKIRNVFDETFQAKPAFQGMIQITSMRNPSIKRTFNISEILFLYVPGYDQVTNTLTFNSGDSIRLGVLWDFKDDTGRDLLADFFRIVPDPQCKGRSIAYAEDFMISGEMRVFEKTGITKAPPILHSFCYVTGDPQSCSPFPFSANCPFRYPQ